MTNVALGIKNNEVIEVDINEALEAEGEFNYDIYDTINILSV